MPDPGFTRGQHAAVHPAFQAEKQDDGAPIVAPGIGALVRRHPRAMRNTATGSMVTGAVLFVAASLMTSAGADPAASAPKHPAPTFTQPIETYTGLPPLPTPTVSAVSAPVAARPAHAKKDAPADAAAISGLAANGIPSVALNAYRVAAARLANADPGCGIDWALLAGIGREESDHGQFGGAVLHADGVSTPRIIGIPLNGHGTALIPDTDHGALDGDTVYDHAVGPMQFIPSTWAEYGTDADGDGRANVFDINDAALTAARYLCAAGGNLRTPAGQQTAILTYNDSDQYLAQVLALADAYRRGIPISGIPVGNTSGSLPPVDAGAVPPANPGPPTANGTSAASGSTSKPSTATGATTSSGGSGGSTTGATSGGGGTGGSATGTGTGTGTGSGTGSGTSTGTGTGSTTTTPTPSVTPTPSPTTTRKCLIPDPAVPGHCLLLAPPA